MLVFQKHQKQMRESTIYNVYLVGLHCTLKENFGRHKLCILLLGTTTGGLQRQVYTISTEK